MKISIITVCYNSAATVKATLKSVAEQTYPHIELIVVDGKSTDTTLCVVQEYNDKIARVISEPDAGIYDAMNKGVTASTGDIIGFLNADDVYADSRVLSLINAIFTYERVDAVFGDVAYYHNGQPDRVVRRYSSSRFSPERLSWGWMPAHPSLFLSRSIFEQTGLFKTDFKIAGDFEFIARAFRKKNVKYVYVQDVFVHMLTGGISTAGLLSTITLNKEVLRACRENGMRTNIIKILSKYPHKAIEYLKS